MRNKRKGYQPNSFEHWVLRFEEWRKTYKNLIKYSLSQDALLLSPSLIQMHRLRRQHLLGRWPSVEDWTLKIISFTHSDAPTSLTASAQSMTFGWRLVGYADIIFKSFIIYFPRYYVCTCYADSKCSVSDLRFNIYIFSSAQSMTYGWILNNNFNWINGKG